MVDVAREIAEIRATMRRAQRRARLDQLRARAIAAARKVPPRNARRRFSVARINAVLARATSIRDAARRLGCAHTTISRHTSPTVQEALRHRGLRWTPAKLLPGVDRDIVLAHTSIRIPERSPPDADRLPMRSHRLPLVTVGSCGLKLRRPSISRMRSQLNTALKAPPSLVRAVCRERAPGCRQDAYPMRRGRRR